ncbi:MAG: HAMP domain-containing histidine kinase [Cocleimonas sp.]|nr:HAMP domain-containing histidine kinase [Cocleimonas sp.]
MNKISNFRQLLNTTAFRLSLIYALLFSMIATIALSLIYWVAAGQIKQQTDQRLRLETDVLMNRYHTGRFDALAQTIQRRNTDSSTTFFIYALIDRRGRDINKSFKPEYITKDRRQAYTTMTLGAISHMIPAKQKDSPARVLLTLLPTKHLLMVGADLNQQKRLLNKIFSVVVSAIAIIFTLALLGGILMGRSVLRRIDAVRKTAGEIIEGDLTQRMPSTRRNDEFDRLSLVLNRMLQRLEQSMQGMREVTDNLAHDLRTPLNRLRNRLELTLLKNPDTVDYQKSQQDAIEDVDTLINTFNSLLNIAQTESGAKGNLEKVDLSLLMNSLGELYEVVAEEENISFSYHIEEDLTVRGNQQLLAQAFTNLIDNAVKYSSEKGHIDLKGSRHNNSIIITISDTGEGIPEDQREHVFKRFVRLDNARTSVGNGLGLSLVKAVMNQHEAEIVLGDNKPGLIVEVILNIAEPNSKEQQ